MNLPLPTAHLQQRRSPLEIQRAVLFALFLREAKSRVGGQWVGAVWTLFEPLAHTLALVTMLGFLRGTVLPGIDYPVFLATGLLPFFLFQNLANRLMDGIEANRGLFSYRQVKPIDCLLTRALVELLMNLLVYMFTLGLLGWLGLQVLPADPLAVIGVHAQLLLLGLGFGLLCAVLGHERPRLRSMIRMTMMPLYLISGVVFQVDLLPREYLDWLQINPLLHLIELSRHAFIPDYQPVEGISSLYSLICGLGLLALGLLSYHGDRQRLSRS